MKAKFIVLISIVLLIVSCNEKKHVIADIQLNRNLEIIYAIENFYYYNQKLPASTKALRDFYEENIDSLFINNFEPKKKLIYVPVFDDSLSNPIAYYIVSTNNNINKIKIDGEEAFLKTLITVCEYNKGDDGDILLYYENPYLVSSGRAAFSLEKALYPHWKNRVFFNVIFDIDSTAVFKKENLDFTVQKDTITINGTFFNKKVKNKVLSKLQNNKKVELQGFKTKNINGKEFVLKDVVLKIKRDSIFGKYFNEVGELENYKHIRVCDSLTVQ
ncbi:hypothetical protein ED312_06500 [Sinomicrobium pectinilyticum]|uniref:Uncharacterized protein n=1 Tax=Sinomicrobium pectinilyticum TaxID=1084421 RepID=A0A3N0ERD7_SINP1|nr:hypothetical protein [Sinomicrobium pectinilyticum]RNL90317.1 hypothetical protein ED312_06500 [Sinomicrobium pectinilyticum]